MRLFRLLDTGRDRAVVWISGPAGSGKTTLVASYLDARKLPCIWYQVDEGDADIATFFYYMGLAAKKAAPRKKKPLPLLTPEYLMGVPTFTRRYFENLCCRLRPPYVIVFDNYQEVSADSRFHEVIRDGLSVIPEGITAIVISRAEPPDTFARLRAGGMAVIGRDALRLTPDESRGVVKLHSRGKLSGKIAEQLHERTRGWAAGLVLLAEAMNTEGIGPHVPDELEQKEIFDYFAGEILRKTDEGIRDFLLKTAFLPKINVPEAGKLTGISHAGRILSALNRNNYFTERLSGPGSPVYQYHPLFREFLLARARETFDASQMTAIRHDAAMLLLESGQYEDAAALLRSSGDWEGVARLILAHAPSLVMQGRGRTLEDWISGIPDEVRDRNPRLLYWLGICRMPFNLALSLEHLEKAFRLFESQGDETGIFLAWAGAVDALFLRGDDYRLLDSWIDWLNERMSRAPLFPSPEIELRVASSMACALVSRRPHHPDIRRWAERALSLARNSGDAGFRMQALFYCGTYYFWMGSRTETLFVDEEIRKMMPSLDAFPLMALLGKCHEAITYNWTSASHELSFRAVSDGLKIADTKGVHVWDHMLFALGVYCALLRQDQRTASAYLLKMESTLTSDRRYIYSHYHYLAAWYQMLFGAGDDALFHAEIALKFAIETGIFLPEALCRLALAHLLCGKKEFEQAREQLAPAHDLALKSGSLMLQFMSLMAKARLALDQGDEPDGLRFLRTALSIGREQHFMGMLWWWHPSVMADLCAKALEAGIETDYVQELIRKHNLVPDTPPAHIGEWPWPLRIYTLGRFLIEKNGTPLKFSGKVQHKPLDLLKALVVLGGRGVQEEQLADLLWPESEGDAAHSAFTTTLSRLRRMLGSEKAIRFQDKRLSLDPRYCWVDVWAFERLLGKNGIQTGARRTQSKEAGSGRMPEIEKAVSLYLGHFLPGDSHKVWTASTRERLKSAFLSGIRAAANSHEEQGEWEKSLEFHQRGLEIDDLQEDFYRGVMTCCRRLGRRADALSVYERCKHTLSSVLKITPSPQTEALRAEILKHRT